MPSNLLRRRPDIRGAEAQLHAATAQIGVATAALFPQFSLTGSVNLQGDKAESLGNWGNHIWSFGPSMNWPIFQGGSTVANIRVQNALQEQALLAYKQTVLTALQDVENALVAYAHEQEHRIDLTEAVEANRKAVELSLRLYSLGRTDFLNVLNAQRSLFAAEDALVRSTGAVSTDLVALYKALGGGWEIESETGPKETAKSVSMPPWVDVSQATVSSLVPTSEPTILPNSALFRIDLSVIALIGIILLIGIVKKNAIMMIDFALEAERREGKSPEQAIFQACLLGFRPITMTTMAALLGGLPLALGTGVGAELRRPLGISIVGGLIFSQALTLFTTPVIYLYLDRFRLWCRQLAPDRACGRAIETRNL